MQVKVPVFFALTTLGFPVRADEFWQNNLRLAKQSDAGRAAKPAITSGLISCRFPLFYDDLRLIFRATNTYACQPGQAAPFPD